MADFEHEWDLLAMAVVSVTMRDPEKRKVFPQKVYDEVLAMAGDDAAKAFANSVVRVAIATATQVAMASPEWRKLIEEHRDKKDS